LTQAWLRTTAASLHRHVIDPNAADVFVYSWNPHLADAFDALYEPVTAASARPRRRKTEETREEAARPQRYATNAPLMRKLGRGALPGCGRECNTGSASWAYTIREAEVLLAAHERARGFAYDAVVFARPDIVLFKDVRAEELGDDPRAAVMPSPNWGDFFFMMRRRTARVFATMYDVAATEAGCVVGCLDAASTEAIKKKPTKAGPHADAQLWKSASVWKPKCSGYVQHGPIRTDSAREIGQTSRS
jgi:hypothetical protein